MNGETGGISRRTVTDKTADVGTFRQKFEGSRSRYTRGSRSGNSKSKALPDEPGYMEKVRAKAHRAGYTARKAASTVALPTARKIESLSGETPKERLTYKVRGGTLTVIDEKGETVMQSNEKGLERYNGLTLQGEVNKEGKLELERGMGDRRKLAEGNGYVTPREEQEIREDRAIDNARKAKDLGEKAWRGTKKTYGAGKKLGAKVKQGGLALGRALSRF